MTVEEAHKKVMEVHKGLLQKLEDNPPEGFMRNFIRRMLTANGYDVDLNRQYLTNPVTFEVRKGSEHYNYMTLEELFNFANELRLAFYKELNG